MKKYIWLVFLFPSHFLFGQQLAPLTVEKIMRDPKWIGSSPSDVFWSPDSRRIYFSWNPEQAVIMNDSIKTVNKPLIGPSDSLYYIMLNDPRPKKVPVVERSLAEAERYGSWNEDKTKLAYVKDNSLCLFDVTTGKHTELLTTNDNISDPAFGMHDSCIIYRQDNNLYAINTKTGYTEQLTDFTPGKKTQEKDNYSDQEQFLSEDALKNSAVLRQRKADKEARDRALENAAALIKKPKTIYTGDKSVTSLSISPDGQYIVYNLVEMHKDVKHTIVPNYVTQSGYTEDIPGRTVAGVDAKGNEECYIYDRKDDSVYQVKTDHIQGIHDLPDYVKDYPEKDSAIIHNPPVRSLSISGVTWNKSGLYGLVDITSDDHKDRWIMLLDPTKDTLKLLDRQRDEAWVGWAPGIDASRTGWLNDNTVWFQSEKTGYSHLYTVNVNTGEEKALTSGNYEVEEAQLSPDKKTFYISTNKIEPGQEQFYQLDIRTGKQVQITRMTGGNQVTVSPDGKNLAFLFSTSIHPWELYLQENKVGAKAVNITDKAESAAYKSYAWREPEIFTFKDRDNFNVYAEVYKPEKPAASHPGVIFVHGAGYLQDVDRWWSYYFREHMFMNLLADQGYTVMNIDYRGSAGYGRNWRTAIYRHMGGKDLEDIVDGAKYMTRQFGVNPEKIGIWGGSYGGFMTLMAMFKSDAFACGAALRSVTDWAHYNNGYTSSILNAPQDDSLAYVRSSPIYFAEGLKGHLLMCHGMVDTNVHFQDIVRLTQKLIELGKKNWQLAVYPVESHEFKEPSSWTDEYSRIYQLFEQNLK